MSSSPESQPAGGYVLTHPVYLDEAMMSSFLAHLEGGFTKDDTVTTSSKGAIEKSRTVGASARARAWILDADARAEQARKSSTEDSTQITAQRFHTASSLFNLLYEYLSDDGLLTPLQSADDLELIRTGVMVDLIGQYEGNPFEDSINALAALVPYFQAVQDAQHQLLDVQPQHRPRSSQGPKGRQESRSQPPTARESPSEILERQSLAAGSQILMRLAADTESAPVRDLVVRTCKGLAVVLTVSSRYYGPEVKEMLRDGEFHVIGKVTRVHDEGTEIRLSRRSVFGALEAQTSQNILDGISAEGLLPGAATESIPGPSVQILPMAIFV